ncbi:MAG: MBL fold metallo-hydrolase [Blastocatellia bacterium]|nr:MBL fold metallo-hydrolase [Blastocatellia bacterium]
MFFKQFYLNCLAHASYVMCSDGEALIVDPQRDVEQYLAEIAAQHATLKFIFETHIHADFVSGHCELAERTGAQIVYGSRADVEFPHVAARTGDTFHVGAVTVSVLETPGHTPEGICLLVTELGTETAPKLLTGDTLFIGDVGRPDLVSSKGFSAQEMAGMLYDSLHEKILPLADEVEIYPAHGAGSLCGKNLSKETCSTLGEQRRFNYALKPMPREEFVRLLTAELPDLPQYFPRDAEINRTGAGSLAALLTPPKLTAQQVAEMQPEGKVLLLDVRSAESYGAGHIPGSINVGLGGQFASWAGTLFPLETGFVLIADTEEQIQEAVTRLARVGMERVVGYLEGGLAAWQAENLPVTGLEQISVQELDRRRNQSDPLQILDVRRLMEYNSGHVPGAQFATLAQIEKTASEFNPSLPTAVICAGGYRSSIAAGFLERQGFQKLSNVIGGTAAWVKAELPVE